MGEVRNRRPKSSAAAGAAPQKKQGNASSAAAHAEDPHRVPWWVVLTTYLNYATLIMFGYVREWYRKIVPSQQQLRKTPPGYAPLFKDFEDFYTRRLYHRIQDCWNRPIASVPGARVDVVERSSDNYNKTMYRTGKILNNCINLASYNYLGFAQNKGPILDEVKETIGDFGVSMCSSAAEVGRTSLHVKLEKLVAEYVGKEDAMVFGMGFATNSTGIPALVGAGDLVISDSLNHASLVTGVRGSGAKVQVFRHNDMKHLESLLRNNIAYGQPRTRRPWKRVFILVEGIYSMEGEIVDLQKIVDLKKKYKCYLYLDEAHSIGAIGHTGRGCCEYTGVNPADVDILMGTFTKSFGSAGGYIAASHELIQYLRTRCWGHMNATSYSPVCVQQTISAIEQILGKDGTDRGRQRIDQLKDNANHFRTRLKELGFQVYGSDDSPVVPVMLYNPAKMPAFSRECLRRGLAVVVVGFPATSIIESRVRFCLSASHTREDLDEALAAIDEVGSLCMIKYCQPAGGA